MGVAMKEGKKCWICKVVTVFAGIGALNWGLVALFDLNLVSALLGESIFAMIFYVLVGLAGVGLLVSLVKPCPCCKPGECKTEKTG